MDIGKHIYWLSCLHLDKIKKDIYPCIFDCYHQQMNSYNSQRNDALYYQHKVEMCILHGITLY